MTRIQSTVLIGILVVVALVLYQTPTPQAQGAISKTSVTDAYANYTVTVSTTALGFPAATLTPDAATTPKRAYCTVDSTNNLRYTYNGTTPSASVGHRGAAGTNFEIYGSGNMGRLRFIREGASDSAVSCTLEK